MSSPYLDRQCRTLAEVEAARAEPPLGDGPFLVMERCGIFNGDGWFIASTQVNRRASVSDDEAARATALANALNDRADLLAALKLARECIAYCRRAHKDAQSGSGFPVEVILDAAIAKAEGR